MTATVRYIVNDVEEAIVFYRNVLGFSLDLHPAPGFAALSLGDLRLLLNQPGAGGAGQARSDGSMPAPGGWNRFQVSYGDLETKVAELRGKGCRFRGELVEGNGGKQALIEDPSGNLIELFEPRRRG